MNKNLLVIASFLLYTISGKAQKTDWKIAEGKITTSWADKVDARVALPEYPRPQMIRKDWKNLNGLWDYKMQPKAEDKPAGYTGKILVPYAIESALSGVGKTVGKDSVLWYKTNFTVPASMQNKTVLLHFGAVDWDAAVYVNGKQVGKHQGGYDPFTFDITPALKKGAQVLEVSVWDPSDDGPQPRGKQVKRPHSIWYTPVTGIWQTVWLEGVPKSYIATTKQTPDIDQKTLNVSAVITNAQPSDKIWVSAWEGTQKIAEQEVAANSNAALAISNPKLWSPQSPFLYDVKVALVRNNKVLDEVKTYSAMRKISMAPDENGVQRMLLNNEFVFQYGPLDQGWWPDGLYTAPTDEALLFDIVKTKEMGFNMIRKHVKVEPARWYRYTDSLGILVWQDMPSGDLGARWESRPGIVGLGRDMDRDPESEKMYRTEWNEIMKDLYNFPSIVVWVPFNEGWGQFKTEEITKWTMQQDPSRLVNSASGGNFHPVGHIMDLHNYPEPAMPDPKIYGSKQIIVLGEFGGLGLPVENHTWQSKDNWGYQSFKNEDELYKRYASFIERFPGLIQRGLSAAVYTQTTDVEIETNGLMTYDRKVIKMAAERLKEIHQKLYETRVKTVAQNPGGNHNLQQ